MRLFPYNGYVQIYRYETNVWRRLTQIDGITQRDRFGGAISMNYDGKRVAVGASYHGSDQGMIEVYEQGTADTVWTMIGEIPGDLAGDRSEFSVALSGDGTTVAVGAIFADPNNVKDAGLVVVYQRTSSLTGWTQLGVDIPGAAASDECGYSVVSMVEWSVHCIVNFCPCGTL
jgi:hypothetical protein